MEQDRAMVQAMWAGHWLWWGMLLALVWLGEGNAAIRLLALLAIVALLAQGAQWVIARIRHLRVGYRWGIRMAAFLDDIVLLAVLMRAPEHLAPALIVLSLGPSLWLLLALDRTAGWGLLTTLAASDLLLRLTRNALGSPLTSSTLWTWATALVTLALVAHAIQRTREAEKHPDVRDQLGLVDTLVNLTATLLGNTDYERILHSSLEAAAQTLSPHDHGQVQGLGLTFSPTNPEEVVVAATFQADPGWRGRQIPLRGLLRDVLMGGEVYVGRADEALMNEISALRHRWLICLPLYAQLDLYGMLILIVKKKPEVSPTQQAVLEAIARQTSQTLQVQHLLYELDRNHREILLSEEDTRHRLARDLHDGPIQRVSAAAMQVDYIRALLENQPEHVPRELDALEETIQQAIQELRTFMFALRPIVLESEGIVAALEQYAKRLRTHERLNIRVEAENIPRLDPVVEENIFAIVQEAVNNARKYAGGAPITVKLRMVRDGLEVEVRDKGPGFDLKQVRHRYGERTSLGLVNMEERADMINGVLTIETAPGKGTAVKLFVPLRQ
ncbi:MAG: sensor histidine kinase [Ardenticatenia bacterium]|nr:sensor histidine kinase [Ardenticatenia bacterium]